MAEDHEWERMLLRAVQAQGGEWTPRVVIAHNVGQRRLTTRDLQVLQGLVDRGILAVRRGDSHAPTGFRWEYRSLV